MPTDDQGQPVAVNIGECLCPGAPRPHSDGDIVFLRPKPTLDMGLAAISALRQSGDFSGDSNAALVSAFVRYGVVAWNIVGPTGPVAVTPEAVLDRLGWMEGGYIVSQKADELYRETVLAPFQKARSVPPRPSPRTGSTSRNRPSGRNTPTSSGPSSPSGPAAGTPS